MGDRRRLIQQAAAVPFRRDSDRIRVCLITSSGSGRWSIPKGIIDAGESAQETALKETEEEAGLSGRVLEDAVGRYRYRKWGSDLTVDVFLLEVEEELDRWPEKKQRRRKWVSLKKATSLLSGHPIIEIWLSARQILEQL